MGFEILAQYRSILVTGPQRSGTRICAKMIAADTGHQYVDERDVGTDSLNLLVQRLRQVARDEDVSPVVIQCPALAAYVHLVDAEAVVWMLRPVEEIRRSARRIAWGWAATELMRYHAPMTACPAEVKLDYWQRVQRPAIEHWYEVEYASLAMHSLWIGEAERRVDTWQWDSTA